MNAQELTGIPVLGSMDEAALQRLAGALERIDFSDGQTVFAEGDPGDSMYFIAEGRIRVDKGTHGGAQKTLTVLERGDYFGEMALLDEKPRSASAIAAGPVKVLRLSKAAFDQMQGSGTSAGVSVLFAMIRTSSERIRRLSSQLVVYDEVGKAIGEARDLEMLSEAILQQLVSATSADWGLVLLRSQFSDRLEIRAAANVSLTPEQREAVGRGQGFLEPLLRAGQEVLVPDFDAHESLALCERLGFETPSLLAAPVAVGGQTLALLLLGGRYPGQFDLDGANLVRGIARQTAQAIMNARHREEEQARSRHSRQYVRF